MFLSIIGLFLVLLQLSVQQSDLKCLVCKQAVSQIASAISNEDQKKTIQVGSFRIQPDGSQKQSHIKYAGSELHLNDILETLCDSMDDFAQAKHKETGELALLNLSKDVDKLSFYDLVPDPNLNRGLKYHCESFVEDHEDDIIKFFKGSSKDLDVDPSHELCGTSSGYCSPHHSEL